MTGGQQDWDVPVESRRIAHPQKIHLKFSKSDTYVEEYLVDLSMTGMFIRCFDPPPSGTRFEFKMNLISGEPSVTGVGEVVWIRKQQERLSHPRGMGVRFVELQAPARDLIRRTVERYTSDPDTAEGFETLRSVVEETLGEVLESKPTPVSSPRPTVSVTERPLPAAEAHPLPRPLPTRKKSQAMWPLLALFVVLMGGATLLVWRSGILGPSEPASQAEPTAEVSAGPEESQPSSEPPVQSEPQISPKTSGSETDAIPASQVLEASPEEIIRGSLDNWAIAWASKEVDAYLGFYSSAFRPASGLKLEDWKQQRRDRIRRPRTIGLEIERVRVEKLSDDRYRVFFEQTYRSDSFEDTVAKTMIWIREAGEWRILEEGAAT